MAAYYLAQQPRSGIKAAVLIGLGSLSDDEQSKYNSMTMLKAVNVPILDLYGTDDLKNVLKTASERQQLPTSRPAHIYQQKRIKGADHFFHGKESVLIQTVDDWLSDQAAR